jgi:hypothetical protein
MGDTASSQYDHLGRGAAMRQAHLNIRWKTCHAASRARCALAAGATAEADEAIGLSRRRHDAEMGASARATGCPQPPSDNDVCKLLMHGRLPSNAGSYPHRDRPHHYVCWLKVLSIKTCDSNMNRLSIGREISAVEVRAPLVRRKGRLERL